MIISLLYELSRKLWVSDDAERLVRQHCLTFELNRIRFGIDTRVINEIARYKILAEPRGMPGFIRGLFRHKGKMIPVIDIAARYDIHPLRPGGRTCIVLVGLGGGKWRCDVGIMVDEIFGVVEFLSADLKPIPEAARCLPNVEVVKGLLKQGADSPIVLDACRLLREAEMESLAEYMRAFKIADLPS